MKLQVLFHKIHAIQSTHRVGDSRGGGGWGKEREGRRRGERRERKLKVEVLMWSLHHLSSRTAVIRIRIDIRNAYCVGLSMDISITA